MRHQAVGGGADQDGARLGSLFQPGGDVDGVAHGRVFGILERAYFAHDHLASVDAHAHRETGDAALLLQPGRVAADGGLHLQPGAHGPFRVVLVGRGCAEEGQHPIAHQPGDGAAVAVDGRDEDGEGRVHDLGDFLGVARFGEQGEAAHIGEEDGHGAALIGFVIGGVRAQRGPTLRAEARHGRVFVLAAGTDHAGLCEWLESAGRAGAMQAQGARSSGYQYNTSIGH